MGATLIELGEYKEAINYFKKTINIQPNFNLNCCGGRGHTYLIRDLLSSLISLFYFIFFLKT